GSSTCGTRSTSGSRPGWRTPPSRLTTPTPTDRSGGSTRVVPDSPEPDQSGHHEGLDRESDSHEEPRPVDPSTDRLGGHRDGEGEGHQIGETAPQPEGIDPNRPASGVVDPGQHLHDVVHPDHLESERRGDDPEAVEDHGPADQGHEEGEIMDHAHLVAKPGNRPHE